MRPNEYQATATGIVKSYGNFEDYCKKLNSLKHLLRATEAESHARTVVRECCKGDDESQWERGKFDPPPPKNPLTDGHQNLCT